MTAKAPQPIPEEAVRPKAPRAAPKPKCSCGKRFLADCVEETLDGKGYVCVKNGTPVYTYEEDKLVVKKSRNEFVTDIANYYGTLTVWEEDSKYFWNIDDYCGEDPKEISKKLYDALVEEFK